MSEHSFAPFIRILGRGKKARRDYTFDEALEAFKLILAGEATQAQIGAFLMLLRVKEETPEELAGFLAASREWISQQVPPLSVDFDWPSYSGKKKQQHWFVLAGLLMAQNGIRVLFHGGPHHTPGRVYTDTVFHHLGLPTASSVQQASQQLDDQHISFIELASFCAPLDHLLSMRYQMGLRSPINTLVRNLNPFQARAGIQSVFHPAYMERHLKASQMLGDDNVLIFKGEGGEAEIRPDAQTHLSCLQQGIAMEFVNPPRQQRQSPASRIDPEWLRQVWTGVNTDAYGENAVIDTVATALLCLGKAENLEAARHQSEIWWDNRNKDKLK